MMFRSAQFRLHLIVFLWGFTAILGKLITVDALELVFYRMLFAALFLYLFIRVVKKQSMKVSRKLFCQLIGVGGLMGDTGCASFILLKYPMYQLLFPVWPQLHYLYLYWSLLFTEGC